MEMASAWKNADFNQISSCATTLINIYIQLRFFRWNFPGSCHCKKVPSLHCNIYRDLMKTFSFSCFDKSSEIAVISGIIRFFV